MPKTGAAKGRARRGAKQKLPKIDGDTFKAAALLCVVEKDVREKACLTVSECMVHAGLPSDVSSSRSFQQRVRRLEAKVNYRSVLAIADDMVNERHPCPPSLDILKNQKPGLDKALLGAAPVHLIVKSAEKTPACSQLRSMRQCMHHAGLLPMYAEEPSQQKKAHCLAAKLSLRDLIYHVDELTANNRQVYDFCIDGKVDHPFDSSSVPNKLDQSQNTTQSPNEVPAVVVTERNDMDVDALADEVSTVSTLTMDSFREQGRGLEQVKKITSVRTKPLKKAPLGVRNNSSSSTLSVSSESTKRSKILGQALCSISTKRPGKTDKRGHPQVYLTGKQ